MYKLVVLLAIAAVALAAPSEEVHDQKAAEQFYYQYGYYPSWYTAAVRTYAAPAVAPVPAYSYKFASAPAYNFAYNTFPYYYV